MATIDIGMERLNWKEQDPFDGVWVQTSESGKPPSRNFRDQWHQLAKYGITRGAYHRAHPSHLRHPVLEARNMWRVVGALKAGDSVATKVTDSQLGTIETVRWLTRHFELLSGLYPTHAYLATTEEFLGWLGNLRSLAHIDTWLIGDETPFPLWQSAGVASLVGS